MATGDLVKLGGFYLHGALQLRPTRPWHNGYSPEGAPGSGNIPNFSPGQTIEIRDTPLDDANKIQWVEVEHNNKRYLYSDRVLLVNVSWEDLNTRGLIKGKEITIDGKKYLLRVLTGGSASRNTSNPYAGGSPATNEWDQIISNELGLAGLPVPKSTDLDNSSVETDRVGEHNQKWNWYAVYSWCQEIHAPNASYNVMRGYNSARNYTINGYGARNMSTGWRPVLEPLPNGKIKDQTPGTVINFAGSLWTIIDPSTGYLFKNESITTLAFDPDMTKVFDPKDHNNIGYYLNTTYYNTLPAADKTMIRSHNWGIQGITTAQGGILNNTPTLSVDQMRNVENGLTVQANIGMLSVSEWRRYSLKYGNGALLDPPNDMWCRAQVYGYSDSVVWFVNTNGSVNMRDAHTNLSVHPTVYIESSNNIVNGTVIPNTIPTVILSTSNNVTLYENDTLNISGEAYDSNKDQSVTVFYQINSEQRKVLATNVSQTQIALSKQILFKGSKLYDGEIAITGVLADGVAHTLKVWAVDSEGGQSTTVERTFYVVPNRAPLLSVDAVVPSGVVDTDIFKISGTSSDQDANATVKVTKKVNANNPVEIYSGPGGAWEFDVSLAQLVVGENTIIIEVIDNYGAKTSKTIKLKKNEVKTPILHAVGRYKITPPAGSAKGVLLFIERDEDMDLTVELSMTLAGEQEQYETLTANNTAPMPNTNGSIVEDTYYYEATEPKDNIILKLSTTRPDANVNHKIHLISGAVE